MWAPTRLGVRIIAPYFRLPCREAATVWYPAAQDLAPRSPASGALPSFCPGHLWRELRCGGDSQTCAPATRWVPPLRRAGYTLSVKRSFAEFFAGIGLVGEGLGHRWSCIYANDFDAAKREMFVANYGGAIDGRDIRDVVAADIPRCDLWTASFPCNNTSIAGSYNGIAGEHSSMVHEFLRIVSEAGEDAPPLIMLENVPGWLMRAKGADLRYVLEAVNGLGYGVDLLTADARWWVPQSRRRLFVIALRTATKPVVWHPQECRIRPVPVIDFIRTNDDLRWIIHDVQEPPDTSPELEGIVERLSPSDPRWWSKERADYLYSQLSQRHRETADAMIRGKRYRYATVFRRVRRGRSMAELRTDGIAGCLRTPRGGSGRQILFRGGGGKYAVRLLTPRECARLQGVRDTYRIPVADNAALFGFGDAVCVPTIRWLSEAILEPAMGKMESALLDEEIAVA